MNLDIDSANSRLNSPNNLANRFNRASNPNSITHEVHDPSTNKKGPNLPQFLRNTIAIMAHGDTQVSVAQEMGVSQQEVSLLKSGKLTDKKVVDAALEKVRDKALDRLMGSLGFITNDKLEKCEAPALSQVAANMSKVISNTLPKENQAPQVNLTIYAPEIRDEKRYEVVEVKSDA